MSVVTPDRPVRVWFFMGSPLKRRGEGFRISSKGLVRSFDLAAVVLEREQSLRASKRPFRDESL